MAWAAVRVYGRIAALLAVALAGSHGLGAETDADADPDMEIARRHFEQGTNLYEAGKYAEAITEFEAARQAKPLPAFDYNIARCHDRLEHRAEAITAYERYTAGAPDAADAAEVRERIRVLKARVAPATGTATVAVPPNPLSQPPASIPHPAAASSTPPRRYALLAAGGTVVAAGLVLLGAALGTGLVAKSSHDDLVANCGAAGDQCPDGYEATRESGRSAELAAWVLAPAGVAALVVGVALLVVGARRPAEKLTLAPALLPGGGTLALWGRW